MVYKFAGVMLGRYRGEPPIQFKANELGMSHLVWIFISVFLREPLFLALRNTQSGLLVNTEYASSNTEYASSNTEYPTRHTSYGISHTPYVINRKNPGDGPAKNGPHPPAPSPIIGKGENRAWLPLTDNRRGGGALSLSKGWGG